MRTYNRDAGWTIYVYDRDEGRTVGAANDAGRMWITITDAATDEDAIKAALPFFKMAGAGM